ncbi:interleukin 17-like protein [Haliotis rufescens]|uniref:interleukin 17-like protein n=1 Tax=Haliotis rufescens TaxID=6454 RepID=UPI00201F8023|nr:interleukin 17-like protein [Haliotis rufescens]
MFLLRLPVFLCAAVAAWCLPQMNVNARERRQVENCQPPANLSLLFESLNQHLNASLYLQMSEPAGNISHLPTELNYHQVSDSQVANRSCPSSVSDDPSAPVFSRSICPWWYNITELPAGHFPSVIPQAVCKCPACVGNDVNECSRVSTNIRVLQEIGCQDGFYKYKPILKTHHVGCTCTKKRTSPTTNDCGGWGCTS